jgi:hypothetical protein
VQFRFFSSFLPSFLSLFLSSRELTFRRPADAAVDVQSGALDSQLLVAIAPVFLF